MDRSGDEGSSLTSAKLGWAAHTHAATARRPRPEIDLRSSMRICSITSLTSWIKGKAGEYLAPSGFGWTAPRISQPLLMIPILVVVFFLALFVGVSGFIVMCCLPFLVVVFVILMIF
ncbi:protein of unknown function [Candidatus Filomicrobium marinum]|uniref:Uncharacterized protein n=1 Tax=Candidatus Filomicrobium marinum TaxID=1608628 RepID=A0A0D6JF99_9HYPH|nr:protein of unknown function [Candidatus Filomicrobium marinum]CPR19075.1 protein of unknown function [Candidatus Filomicrobium marinum]